MKKKIIIVILSIFFYQNCKAFDTTLTTQILNQIQELQVKEFGVFPKGMFPSYRLYALNQDRFKADINPFHTGLIVFTLNKIKNKLTPYQQLIVDSIATKATECFNKFKNTKGRNTFNFWPTDTVKIFPNSGLLNYFDKINSMPDDMDDTVILLMAMNADKSIAQQVHSLMQEFTNGRNGKIKNTLHSNRELPAYSVWFGQKMAVDFDISVLCNVLYFVQNYNLPFTKADSASLDVIINVIKEKKHLTAASYVSPHYATSEIILYHLSRLMSLKPISELEKFKPILIEQTRALQLKSQSFINQVLLSSSLLNWGVQPAAFTYNNVKDLNHFIQDDPFTMFTANIFSMYPDQLKKIGTSLKLGLFNYYCPAYNHVLVLENIILNQQHAQ